MAPRGAHLARVSRALPALVAALALAVVDGSAEARKAALGQSFPLKVGESALVGGEGLRIEFDAVLEDSRCPKGEACVWEGDATVRIRVENSSGEKGVIHLHTSTGRPRAAGWGDWLIRLVSLRPHRVSGRALRTDDYVATLEATRGSPEGEVR